MSKNKQQEPVTQQPQAYNAPPPASFQMQPVGNPTMMPVVAQPQPQQGMAGQPPLPPGYVPPQLAMQWMPQQQRIPNCPPGLEYLTAIDQLLVHQQIEVLELLTGFETSNKYMVKNSVGQSVFFAAESSGCCSRYWCGPIREFEMKIFDNYQQEVISMHRPLACGSCCFPCCLQGMEVSSPPGNVIGSIEQEWTLWIPKFRIKDASGETVLRIEGPCCTCACCSDVVFEIFSKDGKTPVGKISKQWSGFVREAFTDADMFGINFPMDLDVKIKAVLLGACFLIDFMFFEHSEQK